MMMDRQRPADRAWRKGSPGLIEHRRHKRGGYEGHEERYSSDVATPMSTMHAGLMEHDGSFGAG